MPTRNGNPNTARAPACTAAGEKTGHRRVTGSARSGSATTVSCRQASTHGPSRRVHCSSSITWLTPSLVHSDPRGISPDISMTPAPVTPAIRPRRRVARRQCMSRHRLSHRDDKRGRGHGRGERSGSACSGAGATAGTIITRSGTAAAVGRPVTEVPRAQGRTALPWAVQPEKQWAMLRHHAGAGGLACRTALSVAGAASDSCSSAGSARSVASRPGSSGAHAREAHMSSAGLRLLTREAGHD